MSEGEKREEGFAYRYIALKLHRATTAKLTRTFFRYIESGLSVWDTVRDVGSYRLFLFHFTIGLDILPTFKDTHDGAQLICHLKLTRAVLPVK